MDAHKEASGYHKEGQMATGTKKIVKRSGSKATKPKPAAKAKSNGGSKRRTAEDVRKLVPQFVKHLTGGGKMKELKAQHGFSDDGPIRQALYLEGFDSKGNKLDDSRMSKITGSGASLAKKLVSARTNGTPWYELAHRTGKPESELRKIVAEAGGTTGRVYTKSEKPAAKKSAGKATAKKAGGKKTTRKATAAADPSPQA